MSIIAQTAKKLGCTETQVFRRAAIECGYIDYDRQAAIWLSMHIQCSSFATELSEWCLQVLMNHPFLPDRLGNG